MEKKILKNSSLFLTTTLLALFFLLLTLPACKKSQQLKDFQQVTLVANTDGYGAARIDPNLVNAWGIAFAPSGPAWVSSMIPGLSVVYNSLGADVRPPVTVPGPASVTGGHPTGAVFNGSTTDFKLLNGNPARFIFAGIDGVISGWNTGNAAELVKNAHGAVYTGLALATDGAANFIYAANFKEGTIDVYDKDWNEVSKPFNDPFIPSGYAPFNIQNVGGKLYVTYAKPGTDGRSEAGAGKGFVDIYNPDGSLVKRFISRGALNAPWGVAQTPAGFFEDNTMDNVNNKITSPVVLIGNFGNGHINVYNESGVWLGDLRKHGAPIAIEGLWAISFAPSTATTVNPDWLFFAAGPNNEEDGLYGYITK